MMWQGDGTTTSTLLTQAIVNTGFKNVTAGANPMMLKIGMEKAVEVGRSRDQKDGKNRQRCGCC